MEPNHEPTAKKLPVKDFFTQSKMIDNYSMCLQKSNTFGHDIICMATLDGLSKNNTTDKKDYTLSSIGTSIETGSLD